VTGEEAAACARLDARAERAVPGSPFPLGAVPGTFRGTAGTNFAIASSIADSVWLCLFDDRGRETRIPLRDRDNDVWHAFVPGVRPGQAYGYRVGGPWEPTRGLRCNPAKLLLDPYALAVAGLVSSGPEVLGHADTDPGLPSTLDSSAHVPRSLVADPAFDWRDGDRPRRGYADTVIYEVHVKGFTMRHPDVPHELRGTYAGLGHNAAIGHLLSLGVTAVELLPVHQNVPEPFLAGRGLTNYWGYNTIGYFADLVSYNDKHNEANGEDNRDGTTDNRSWNCGAEGPTADPGILALRARQSRAMLTTLMLSFGIPLLLGGDEMGRTQRGNNNAYCQDNELTWFDWANADTGLLEFTRRLIEFRRAHPVFRRLRFLSGTEASQLQWFTPAGTSMDTGDWADPNARALAIYLDGADDPDRAADGTFLVDDDFMVMVNSWWEPLGFVLPATRAGAEWQAEIDSYDPATTAAAPARRAGETVTVGPRSVLVLRAARRGGWPTRSKPASL
jgi:pullulanase/glycogen debranching enzyme